MEQPSSGQIRNHTTVRPSAKQAKATRRALKYAEESAKRPAVSKLALKLAKEAGAALRTLAKGDAASTQFEKIGRKQSATSREKPKRKPRAAEILKVMCAVLNPREIEIAISNRGFIVNRYGIFSTEAGGPNYGFAADIYLALVRILDRLRLHEWDKIPASLSQLVEGDQFESEDLKQMYDGDGDFQNLRIDPLIREVVNSPSWASVVAALLSCIVANFEFITTPIKTKQAEISTVDNREITRKAVEQALENRQHWLSQHPIERENFARRAGWTKATEKRRELKKNYGINSLRQTCAEGGSHV